MKKIILLGLTLILIVFISCCISNTGTTNLVDVINNPAPYENKTITVTGIPVVKFGLDYLEFSHELSTKNKEGKSVGILTDKENWYCQTCKVTGIVQKTQSCLCQGYSIWGEWSTDGYRKTVGECIKSTTNRCATDSYEDFYYLHVTDVESLDNY